MLHPTAAARIRGCIPNPADQERVAGHIGLTFAEFDDVLDGRGDFTKAQVQLIAEEVDRDATWLLHGITLADELRLCCPSHNHHPNTEHAIPAVTELPRRAAAPAELAGCAS